MFFFCEDVSIFLSPQRKDVDQVIYDLKLTSLDLVDRDDITDYLGINFSNEKGQHHNYKTTTLH